MPPPGEALTIPELVITSLKWILLAAICAVIILRLVRAMRRYEAQQAGTDVDEINESLGSWGGFKADLLLFFRLLLGRLRGRINQVIPNIYRPRQPEVAEIDETLSIRQLYRRLLQRAVGLGIAHQSWETPYEYATRLIRALPDDTEPVAEITQLYVEVRYGEMAADEQQVLGANRLWRWLKVRLRKTDQAAV